MGGPGIEFVKAASQKQEALFVVPDIKKSLTYKKQVNNLEMTTIQNKDEDYFKCIVTDKDRNNYIMYRNWFVW